MQYDIKSIWGMVEHIVEKLGATLVKNKVSRVDACVDLANVPFQDFAEVFRAGQYITRAHSRAGHSVELPIAEYDNIRKPTGFVVGKSPILVRVYDKDWESRLSPEKRALLVANRWGREVEHATRVEIQLGRERLKTFGVDSVEHWLGKRGAICNEVLTKWLRLTEGPVDRNHANRIATHHLWKRVLADFATWCGNAVGVNLTPLAKLELDMSRRYATAFGIIFNGFARSGKEIESDEHAMRELRALYLDVIGDRDVAEIIRRKALELAAA